MTRLTARSIVTGALPILCTSALAQTSPRQANTGFTTDHIILSPDGEEMWTSSNGSGKLLVTTPRRAMRKPSLVFQDSAIHTEMNWQFNYQELFEAQSLLDIVANLQTVEKESTE